jgi:HEAT repeat protein
VDLEALKEAFSSTDWGIAEPALDKLVSIGGDEVLAFFVSFLAGTDVLLRNRASIGLHDLGDSRAVEPLMQAI